MTANKKSGARRKSSRSTDLLREVIEFSRSETGLESGSFLGVLRKNYPGLTIHAYEARGRRITPIETSIPIEKLVSETDINTCLLERKAIETRTRQKKLLLVPVLINDSASSLIVAERTPRSRVDLDEFVTLVGVYGTVLSLFRVSERDSLTGLFNRRMIDRHLPELMLGLTSPRRRSSDPATAHLALMDLDRFKKINDTFGHLHGDEVLLLFGGLMSQSFRSTDVLVRYGGEEFVVVLSDTTSANCEMVLERFREKVEGHWFPEIGHVTVSIGAVRIETQKLPAEVLGQADQALYYAKRSGRNKVCIYETLGKQGLIKGYQPVRYDDEPHKEKRKLPTRRKPLRPSRKAHRRPSG